MAKTPVDQEHPHVPPRHGVGCAECGGNINSLGHVLARRRAAGAPLNDPRGGASATFSSWLVSLDGGRTFRIWRGTLPDPVLGAASHVAGLGDWRLTRSMPFNSTREISEDAEALLEGVLLRSRTEADREVVRGMVSQGSPPGTPTG